jgi:hypothetical protein
MDSVSARSFVADQIPVRHQALLPPVLKTAYRAVQLVVKDAPFLQVPSATFNRGRMVTWAVDHGIEQLIKSGQWPVDYRWASFGEPTVTGKYIEIILPHSRMTISQVRDASNQPRDVKFRENARLDNDPFLPYDELSEVRTVTGIPTFILVHGHKDLDFIHVGVPHSHHPHAYIYRTNNLLQLPHEVPSTAPPVENTDFEDTMTLKEEIEKWRKDHGA